MSLKTPSFWYREDGAKMGLRETLLTPLSMAYTLSYRMHQGSREAYNSYIPVVCIGNLVAGGTGKTPTVIALLKAVIKAGLAKNPHFLIRGYGGAELGPLLVDSTKHNAWDVGDEALILSQHAPTIVGGDRAQSAKLAERLGADLLIMDDGLQNPTLHKDLKFVVINGEMGFGNGKMLPAGPLRQPMDEGMKAADGFILIGKDCRNSSEKLPKDKPVLRAHLKGENLEGFDKDMKYLAFAGLGYPDKFFNFLTNDVGLNLCESVPFSDHHPYNEDDLRDLHRQAKAHGAELITTRKDAMRLPRIDGIEVHVMPVVMAFDEPETLLEAIKAIIK